MNITNSIVLLLCLILSISDVKATDTAPLTDDKKDNKEIIIIQIDDQIEAQLSSIADYAYDLYQKHNRGLIKVTTYTDLSDESAVTKLISLLDKKGLDSGDMVAETKGLEVDNPYFTISVTAGPAVQ